MKIDADVVASVRQGSPTAVIISLTPPAGYGEEGADLAAMQAAIARVQDEVLVQLDSSIYENRIRFDAVPALAGTILSPRALGVLERHPRVVAVALDLGGVGQSLGGRPDL
jgi:hypothetical protein